VSLKLNQLCQAFSDLVLEPHTLSQIGQALNDGRGLFLYGNPGNGKTSIAERVCDAFGQNVWIPRMVSAGGELIRLFDPSCHVAVKLPQLDAQRYDRRWVLIRRPTIIVGGELTLQQLDMQFIATAGISEAPLHLKSNCGAFVVDDFGRQRVSSSEILNRLIVPLEKQYDFLHLPSGRQIQTPFDQLLVFSTNLEPRDLVDEAFLRRIPYKIEVLDPDEADFRRLFEIHARDLEFELQPGALEYLIENYYKQSHRPFRFCHPRDLMRQVKNLCQVHELPLVATKECFDVAVRNYFGGL
jgi:predicted ATPase with chaperone activity